jgi:hypothetical protein
MPDPAGLFSSLLSGPFAYTAQFFWVVQILLVIHVFRTGRSYMWIWLLLMAPFIGGAVYFFVEILPDLRQPSTGGLLPSWRPRKWRIAALRHSLEETDTVQTRLALAQELADGGFDQEAHDVAAECLQGVFADDAHTLLDVAGYKVGIARFEDALALLNRITPGTDRMLALQVCLVKGDCYVGLGLYPGAEAEYEKIAPRYTGEAVRYGLACVYEKTGRLPEAVAIWKDIRKKFRKSNPAWKRTERKYYKLAGQKLSAQKS